MSKDKYDRMLELLGTKQEPMSKEEIQEEWDSLNAELRFNYLHQFDISNSEAQKEAIDWFKDKLKGEIE